VPKVSLADTFDDWESLLRAAAPYGDQKGLQVYLDQLAELDRRLHEIEARRAELQALRQEATQQLEEVRKAGKDVAIQIRTTLKGILGPRNEGLVKFRIRPRRS
jgi:seryl-tRNA synthetase